MTVSYRYSKVSSEAARRSAAGVSTCLAVLFFVVSNRELSCANPCKYRHITFVYKTTVARRDVLVTPHTGCTRRVGPRGAVCTHTDTAYG